VNPTVHQPMGLFVMVVPGGLGGESGGSGFTFIY
jgi:hypothetical protein